MSDYHNFTSLSPQDEAQFVVFERRTQESQQKAFMIALISSVAFLVLALGVYFGVEPHKDNTARDMDMTQLKSKKDAPKPAAAPAAAPAPAAPAPAPAAPAEAAPAPAAPTP